MFARPGLGFLAPLFKASGSQHGDILLIATITTIFNWTLCEWAQHLAGDCRDVHSLWCETGSVIDSCLKTKKTWK